jgi:hypothetical protein
MSGRDTEWLECYGEAPPEGWRVVRTLEPNWFELQRTSSPWGFRSVFVDAGGDLHWDCKVDDFGYLVSDDGEKVLDWGIAVKR